MLPNITCSAIRNISNSPGSMSDSPGKTVKKTALYSPRNLQTLCLRSCIQHNLLKALKEKPHLIQAELEAVAIIRNGLEVEGMTLALLQRYFDKQWGETSLEQLKTFFDVFDQLPSKILKNKMIHTKTLVNRNFIRAWRMIEAANAESTIFLDFSCKATFYLPRNISRLKNLETLCLFNTDLSTLPPEILALQKLKYLNIAYNKFTKLPPKDLCVIPSFYLNNLL